MLLGIARPEVALQARSDTAVSDERALFVIVCRATALRFPAERAMADLEKTAMGPPGQSRALQR